MQLASSARLPDGLLAAQWLGAEKPHQGVSTQKQAWHPAPSVCNSTTALGLRAGCAGNRVRSFCSGEQFDSDLGLYYLRARYYNPATGRFLSRDPEEFKPLDSKRKPVDSGKLHRYLYAGADPVNRIDPSGRIFEYMEEIGEDLPAIEAMEDTELALRKVFDCVAMLLLDFDSGWQSLGYGPTLDHCIGLE
jgi:RHS repeat-associated protein